ncbi:hypothetical protein EV426DRAFT_587947 [Tirmania nivea]|nr:hypothetical protein EV426DRAFT_587947 [Tirmania nivea]
MFVLNDASDNEMTLPIVFDVCLWEFHGFVLFETVLVLGMSSLRVEAFLCSLVVLYILLRVGMKLPDSLIFRGFQRFGALSYIVNNKCGKFRYCSVPGAVYMFWAARGQ